MELQNGVFIRPSGGRLGLNPGEKYRAAGLLLRPEEAPIHT